MAVMYDLYFESFAIFCFVATDDGAAEVKLVVKSTHMVE